MAIKELSKVFEGTLKFFKHAAGKNKESLRGSKGGINCEINWQDPEKPGPDRDDPKQYNQAFDRYSLLNDYRDARNFEAVGSSDNGIVSDVVMVTRQHEFLSGLQRDYMARKMSRVQAVGLDAERSHDLSEDSRSPLQKTLYGMIKRWFSFTGNADVA